MGMKKRLRRSLADSEKDAFLALFEAAKLAEGELYQTEEACAVRARKLLFDAIDRCYEAIHSAEGRKP